MARNELREVGLSPASTDDGLLSDGFSGNADGGAIIISMSNNHAEDSHPSCLMSALEDADSSSRTHDQLPSVESYKAQETVAPSRPKPGNRLIKVYLASLLTIILLIIFVAVVAALGSRHSKANAESVLNNRTMPVDSGTRVTRLREVLDFIGHEQNWSDPTTLDANSTDYTPQYLAARWMADLDHRHVALDDLEEFRTRYVLALFYHAMHGDRWEHEANWLTMHSFCAWNNDYPSATAKQPIRIGVECDAARGNDTVTKIFLPSLDLQGELPSELGLLVDLEVLDLYSNDISGNIPETLQALKNLKSLVLHNNHMGGSLPTWIDKWTSLETLDLAQNRFTGTFPPAFAELSNLNNLNLEFNQITGTLETLAENESLRYLALGDNKLKGNLTAEMISFWFRLTDLDLSDNNIAGTLPFNLFNAKSLETIDLHGNKFTGTIPYLDDDNTRLKFLALFENELSGSIDGRLAKLRSLEHLDLSRNSLTGPLPEHTIATMVQLKYLFLAFNPFEAGPIPPYWASLYQLRDLSLQKTNRNGEIPKDLSILDNLILVDFSNNNLTGSVPDEFGSLTSLKFLILKNNKLSGRLPTTLGALVNLDTLVIDNNDFDGGSGNICSTVKPLTFVSDCVEVGCSCCSECCDDQSAKCFDKVWFAQQDPSMNYQYTRVAYKFNEEDIAYPVTSEADGITAFYDTFGLAIDDELFRKFVGRNVSDP